MRVLLDTHVLVWALGLSHHLTPEISRLLNRSTTETYFSAVSIMEIAVKRSTGRRDAPPVSAARATELSGLAGYLGLHLTHRHAEAVETLALTHGDPFDRMLLAQSQVEDLRLVTHDEQLAAYDSRTILF